MRKYFQQPIFRIVIIYLMVSLLWIFFSDRFLAFLIRNPDWLTQAQTYKGWFFVLGSSLLLYVLLQRETFGREVAEDAFRKSQKGFQQLFANNPMPMWLYDRDSLEFLAVNEAAILKYGYSREEFLNMSVADIHPPEDVAALIVQAKGDQPAIQYSGQKRHITKNRNILFAQVVSHTMDFGGRQAMLETAEDISYHKRVESAYQSAEQRRIAIESMLNLEESRLHALFQLSQMSDASEDEIIQFALKEAAHLSSSSQVLLGFFDQNQTCLMMYEWNIQNKEVKKTVEDPNGKYAMPWSAWEKVIQNRQPLLINSRDQAINRRDGKSGDNDLVREMIVPVVEGDQVMAVAAVKNKNRAYDDADARQLTLLMGWVNRIIERNRMVAALKLSRTQLESAVENLPFDFWMQDKDGRYVVQNDASIRTWGNLIGKQTEDLHLDPQIKKVWEEDNQRAYQGEIVRSEKVYHGSDDLGIFLNIVAPVRDDEEIRGTLGMNIDISALKQKERELQAIVSIAAALRRAPSRLIMQPIILEQVVDLLNIENAMLVSKDVHNQNIQVDLGRGAWVDLTGEVISSDDTITNSVLSSGEAYWTSNIPSQAVLREIVSSDEIVSAACIPLVAEKLVLGALWVGSKRPLREFEVELLGAIADIAANALHRAKLIEQTEMHLQRLTALRAIDLAITASLDLRVTLNILLNQITSQVGVDAADVLLYNPHTQTLEFGAGRGFSSQEVTNTRIRLGENYAGKVALERKLEFIPNLHKLDGEIPTTLAHVTEGYTSYIALPLIAKGQTKGVLELYQLQEIHQGYDWLEFLQAIAAQAAIAIDNAELFDQLQRSNIDLTRAYDATIEGWARALELRDRDTEGHTRRVLDTTLRLVRASGVKDEEIVHVRRGVLLHDIGKMAIPDEILLKPGPLNDHEWEIMRMHPQYAYEMLSPIPYLRPAIDIPYCHHEKWDGSGYPRGLKGEQIPLSARIFSIVDNWDALRSIRPYRAAWPEEKVLKYIQEQSGKGLDPDLVPIFMDVVTE